MTTQTSRRELLRLGTVGMACSAGAAALLGPAAASAAQCAAITREQFDDYIKSFNNNDSAGFSKYYDDDVVLELGERIIRTRQGIVDFYAEVKSYVHEKLEVTDFIADATGVAAEIPTEFVVYRDWDNFLGRKVRQGDVMHVTSFVHYRVRDGKFVHIKTAPYRRSP